MLVGIFATKRGYRVKHTEDKYHPFYDVDWLPEYKNFEESANGLKEYRTINNESILVNMR
jgi:hypothetical protein